MMVPLRYRLTCAFGGALLLALGGFVVIATSGACSGRRSGEVSIPVTVDGLIAVGVNGLPLHLVLDTGATDTIVREEAVESLRDRVKEWPRGEARSFRDATGNRTEITSFLPEAILTFGNASFIRPSLPMFPRPREASSAIMQFVPSRDGLLGMDVLRKLVLWVDMAGRQVRILETSEAVVEQMHRYGRKPSSRLALVVNGSRPMVRVRLCGSMHSELLLDTGATRTSIPVRAAAELRLGSGLHLVKEERYDVTDRAGRVVGSYVEPAWDGASQGWLGISTGPRPIFELPELEIGPHIVRSLPVTEAGEKEVPKVGRDVLGRFEWIWDGPGEAIWFLGAF
jgi:hypothetical protein